MPDPEMWRARWRMRLEGYHGRLSDRIAGIRTEAALPMLDWARDSDDCSAIPAATSSVDGAQPERMTPTPPIVPK